MARYSPAFKNKAVTRLLPPEASLPEIVAREIGIGTDTLLRWQRAALSAPTRTLSLTAADRFDAVIHTDGMDESGKNAWCREHGVYPGELSQWRTSAAAALADTEPMRAGTQQTRQDKKRIKELERDVNRKNAALAETTALLVLAKKLSVIFQEGADA